MLKNGYIKLYRSLLDWEWYDDEKTLKLFLHLLFTVSIEDSKWHGHTINRGSRIASYQALAEETKLSVKNVRTIIKRLETTGEVARSKMPKFTIFTVVNYDKFQEGASKTASKGQGKGTVGASKGQQYKKIKEDNKKIKEERGGKLTLGYNKNVFLSETELAELKRLYPKTAMQKIERLSTYLVTSGREYKNHFAVIKGWCEEDKDKDEAKTKTDKPKEKKTSSYDLSDFEAMALMSTPKGSEKD